MSSSDEKKARKQKEKELVDAIKEYELEMKRYDALILARVELLDELTAINRQIEAQRAIKEGPGEFRKTETKRSASKGNSTTKKTKWEKRLEDNKSDDEDDDGETLRKRTERSWARYAATAPLEQFITTPAHLGRALGRRVLRGAKALVNTEEDKLEQKKEKKLNRAVERAEKVIASTEYDKKEVDDGTKLYDERIVELQRRFEKSIERHLKEPVVKQIMQAPGHIARQLGRQTKQNANYIAKNAIKAKNAVLSVIA